MLNAFALGFDKRPKTGLQLLNLAKQSRIKSKAQIPGDTKLGIQFRKRSSCNPQKVYEFFFATPRCALCNV